MKFTPEEIKALRIYFDNISINLTAFSKKHGREITKDFSNAIDKLYKNEPT